MKYSAQVKYDFSNSDYKKLNQSIVLELESDTIDDLQVKMISFYNKCKEIDRLRNGKLGAPGDSIVVSNGGYETCISRNYGSWDTTENNPYNIVISNSNVYLNDGYGAFTDLQAQRIVDYLSQIIAYRKSIGVFNKQ